MSTALLQPSPASKLPVVRATAVDRLREVTGDALPVLFDPVQAPQLAIDRRIVESYLADHPSAESRRVLGSAASRLARLGGYADYTVAPWSALLASGLGTLRNLLNDPPKPRPPATEIKIPPSTINLYLSVAKGIATHAYRMRVIDVDQFTQIRLIKGTTGQRSPRGRALPVSEVTALMETCLSSDDPIAVRDATIMALGYGCGFRRGELASVNMDDCDLTKGEIKVIGKRNKQRTVAMPLRVMQILQRWLDTRGVDPGPLFTRYQWRREVGTKRPIAVRYENAMQRLSTNMIYRIVRGRAKQAGLSHTSPHDLRRSFATYLLSKKTNIHVVAHLMGHENVETTKLYDKGKDEAAAKAIAKIDF